MSGIMHTSAASTSLGLGSSGPQVVQLQQRLNYWIQHEAQHYRDKQLVVDGKYGPNTRYVVACFQNESGLHPSGEVDGDTLHVLNGGSPSHDQGSHQEEHAAGGSDQGGDASDSVPTAVYELD